MIRRLLFLLLICAGLHSAKAGTYTLWEGKVTFPADWSQHIQIDGQSFKDAPYGEELTIYYDDLYATEENAALQIYVGWWTTNVAYQWIDKYDERFTYPAGSFKVKLTRPQAEQMFSEALVVQGTGLSIVKIEIEECEPTIYFHDLIYGENSSFEIEPTGWESRINRCEFELTSPGYDNSASCMRIINKEEGQAFSKQFTYNFAAPLEAGTYKLQLYAKTDIARGATPTCWLMNGETFMPVAFGSFNVGADWALCEAEMTLPEGSSGINRLVLNFGEKAGSYMIDNLRFGPLKDVLPDENILYIAPEIRDTKDKVGYISTDNVSAGDVLRLTFADSQDGYLCSLANKKPVGGTIDFKFSDFQDGCVTIGVVDEMIEPLLSGVYVYMENPGIAKTLTRIEVIKSVFNPSGMIAYGHRNPGKHTIYTSREDIKWESLAMICDAGSGSGCGTIGTSTHPYLSWNIMRERLDGKKICIATNYSGMGEDIAAAGWFRCESDLGIDFFYDNPTAELYVPENGDIVMWEKPATLNWDNSRVFLQSCLFSDVHAGDRIELYVDDACMKDGEDYASLQVSGTMGDYLPYHFGINRHEVSADGHTRFTIDITDDDIEVLRKSGLSFDGSGMVLSRVVLKPASTVTDENVQFFGFYDLATGGYGVNLSSFEAGDVLRLSFSMQGYHSKDVSIWSPEGSTCNIPYNIGISYDRNFIDLGVTAELLENSKGFIFLSSRYYIGLNRVERIPHAFDPKEYLVYAPHDNIGTNIGLDLPGEDCDLEILFSNPDNSSQCDISVLLCYYDDNNERVSVDLGFFGMSDLTLVDNGYLALTVPLKAEHLSVGSVHNLIIGHNGVRFDHIRRPATSAIDKVDVDKITGKAVYYNLQGVRVDNPSSGIYIRKQGSSVSKVLIRN